MLFHNDIWDFVYYVDINNLDNQEKRFFDGTTEKVVNRQECKSIEMVICLASDGIWKVVDENFYQSKLEKQYIKFGTKIKIETAWGLEIHTLCKIGTNLFTLIHNGQCWEFDFMISDRSDSVSLDELTKHIDRKFEIMEN